MKDRNADYAAFVLRLGLGTMFLAHGLLKFNVFTLAGTAQFFESAGFPGALAYVVTFAEIGGGIALLAGVATRWIVLGLMPVLLGAVKVHFGAGWVFSNANGGWEYPAFLIVAAVAQLFLGSGAFALRLPRWRTLTPATSNS